MKTAEPVQRQNKVLKAWRFAFELCCPLHMVFGVILLAHILYKLGCLHECNMGK